MSIQAAARRDAERDFLTGRPQHRYPDHDYYKGCYDLEWQKLEKQAAEDLEREEELRNRKPTLEERVAALEEQVAELTRSLGL